MSEAEKTDIPLYNVEPGVASMKKDANWKPASASLISRIVATRLVCSDSETQEKAYKLLEEIYHNPYLDKQEDDMVNNSTLERQTFKEEVIKVAQKQQEFFNLLKVDATTQAQISEYAQNMGLLSNTPNKTKFFREVKTHADEIEKAATYIAYGTDKTQFDKARTEAAIQALSQSIEHEKVIIGQSANKSATDNFFANWGRAFTGDRDADVSRRKDLIATAFGVTNGATPENSVRARFADEFLATAKEDAPDKLSIVEGKFTNLNAAISLQEKLKAISVAEENGITLAAIKTIAPSELTKGTFGIELKMQPDAAQSPIFFVPEDDNSPIKDGDVIVFDVNGKKINAVAVRTDAEMPEGLAGEVSPALAKLLGIKDGEQAELSYQKVGEAQKDKLTEVIHKLHQQNGGQALIASNPAGSPTLPAPLAGGTVNPDDAVELSEITVVADKFDLSAIDGLVSDINNGERDDYTAMHHRLAELEKIPELAAEVNRLKQAIARTGDENAIGLNRQGTETHVISTGASQVVQTLTQASKSDGSLDLEDAKRVLLATAEAVELNTVSGDSRAVNGQMLEAIAQAKANGADAASIMALAENSGTKPQNLTVAAGQNRAPGG